MDYMENFELDIFKERYLLNEVELFEDGKRFFSEMITEATENTTKKNVFFRLWDMIVKCCKWLWNKMQNFYKFIVSLFSGKKKKKSADQCLKEAIPNIKSVKNNVRPNIAIASPNVNMINNNVKGIENKSGPALLNNSSNNKLPIIGDQNGLLDHITSIKIPVRINPASEIKTVTDINIIFKELEISFNSNSESITLTPLHVRDTINDPSKQGSIKGQTGVSSNNCIYAFHILEHKEYIDIITDVLDAIINKAPENEFNKKFKILREYDNKMAGTPVQIQAEYTISLKELKEFSATINKLNEKVSKTDMITVDIDKDKLEIVNIIGRQLGRLQLGLNYITATITQSYIVDARYNGSVDNCEDLSKFVQNAIESGIPPKYIMYNAYILSSEKIKGDGSQGNENDPIWGQSRLVMFPPRDKIVHKIALSGWGLRANKVEETISKRFNKLGHSDLLANIVSTSNNRYIVDAQRAVMDENISDDKIVDLRANIDSVCKSNKINIDMTFDIHKKNVGIINNKLVAIDYGNIDRTESGQP